MKQESTEQNEKNRRTNISLGILLGVIALAGFVWPLVMMMS